jgi:uncharacterized protein
MRTVAIHATRDGVPIGGSLWLPAGEPRGLLLMHPGSGPSDRDNDVLFPPIREVVLGRRVAVCSFDKRGVGESGGDWTRSGIPDQAEDLLAGLAAARAALGGLGYRLPTALFGHSQGGWVVLEAAARADARFVVTNSGPAVTPGAQELHSTRRRLTELGWSAEDIADAVALAGRLYALAGARRPFADAAGVLAGRPDLVAGMVAASVFLPDGADLWTYAGSIMDYDPAPALAALRTPLLALLGEQDDIVPVARSAEVFRSAVDPALLDLRIIDGGDHRMQSPGAHVFVAGYLDAVADYVATGFGERN